MEKNNEGWTALTNKLTPEAKAGDPDAIRKWLAGWSASRKVEAIVWIDRGGERPQVEAGTAMQAEKVPIPGDLLARLKSADERIELWHNHPATANESSIAAPGPQDIAVATLPGVTALNTVDDEGRRMRIEAAEPRFGRPDIVRDWTQKAADRMHRVLMTEFEPPADAEAQRDRDIALTEATVGAAVAMGLIQAHGLSERGISHGQWLAR